MSVFTEWWSAIILQFWCPYAGLRSCFGQESTPNEWVGQTLIRKAHWRRFYRNDVDWSLRAGLEISLGTQGSAEGRAVRGGRIPYWHLKGWACRRPRIVIIIIIVFKPNLSSVSTTCGGTFFQFRYFQIIWSSPLNCLYFFELESVQEYFQQCLKGLFMKDLCSWGSPETCSFLITHYSC